jgi:23S rRNA (uracil1939-C5)-methyltransferase
VVRPSRHRNSPRRTPSPAPARRPGSIADATPRCRHFGTCGGCSLLDQPIVWQLHDKVAAAEAALAPFLDDVRVAFEEPARTPVHHRTRLLYPVRADRDGKPIVGIYEFRSHHVVRIEECRTQDPWLTDLGRAMETILRDLGLAPWVPARGKGHVKAITARLASGTGEVQAGIVTRPGAFPRGQDFARAVADAAAALPAHQPARTLVGVVHGISDRDDEFLLADRHVPLRGRDHVVDRRDGLTFRISAGSFYQVHAGAHALLYHPALAMCGDVRGRTVVDGFGGVGTFGLRLARAGAAAVTIVEDNPASCRDATHNAHANELPNVQVVEAPFAKAALPDAPDLMVVDPPRAGLGEAGTLRVLASRPARLLYVACATDSLARDLAVLTASGYRVTAARLCDLFPHTEHVELVVLLQRAG